MSLIRRIGGKKGSQNIAILGDNQVALTALKTDRTIMGGAIKVDLIYIDPPYNVGGDQGYRNVFRGRSKNGFEWAGDHGAFLDFMEPRIKIGRELLKEDGIIFVSICDGEYCRLKILMDHIFHSDNCLGTMIWNKRQGPSSRHLSTIHEYIIVYARNAKRAKCLMTTKPGSNILLEKAKSLQKSGIGYIRSQRLFADWINEQVSKNTLTSGESMFKYLHPETYRPFKSESTCAQDKPETRYHDPLIHPITRKPCKVPKNGWKWKKETLMDMLGSKKNLVKGDGFIISGKIIFGQSEDSVPRQIYYLDEKLKQVLPTMIEDMYCVGHNDLPDGIKFSTPKPVKLIKKLVESFDNKNAVVLDFFAGSGVTAQAVYELNREDGGNRNWILVEQLESTFYGVMIPRLNAVIESKDFSIFEAVLPDAYKRRGAKAIQKDSQNCMEP
ncbi:MAG: site-specific DNA-methyltransferase [Oligoflexales bacterium]|nr:site-specific DNA-methyltransferase [Oligoflexales bacterium]